MTAICYYIIATYRYLPFFASTVMTKAEAYLAKTKYSQYRNETNGALTVYLQPVERPYGSPYSSFTVY